MFFNQCQRRRSSNAPSCLNPYFNGICSLTDDGREGTAFTPIGLNPYFNGICSLTTSSLAKSSPERKS